MAAVRKSDATRVLPVLGMLVECNVAGEGWQELKGASLVDHTSGSRSVSQTATFRGPGATVGAKTVENVTLDLAAVNPGLQIMDDLNRADEQQLNVSVRMSIYSKVIRRKAASAATAAVAVPSDVANSPVTEKIGGKVTFAAAGSDEVIDMVDANEIMVSDLLVISGAGAASDANTFIVNAIIVDETTDSIRGATAGVGVYVTRMNREAVAAVNPGVIFDARTAGWRQRFSALVNQFGSIQGDASGSPSLSSGVVFTPHALLARPTILRLDEGGN